MTEEDQKKYDLYLSEREKTIEMEHRESEQYDKLLVALSSGAFSLSILFVNSIDNIEKCSKFYLAVSWFFSFLCLFSTLTSFLLSQSCTRFYREEVLEPDLVWDEVKLKIYDSKMDHVKYCNLASFGFLILGSIFLGIFVYLNL
ncbi:MAG TPA: hypothetical protein DCM07_18915 [Planctomycetaceae bacterium]|uniref:hypothetical protein n=1 Tax=Gimesia sp. TaxID=2024833 RepID=UPI000C480CBC|nr:hypothetical protein [Gimesia sp.]MAX35734.1 hypothetical protein [Gimesia sp.]HAH46879.1 hypothetical protein [Planctomycetaceae bacterium]HBL47691.1 hypothetical protein [Planctomycetaceae bacterium]|tara:strand:+ start:846 stop:1277 length:432 start_codon:yes stop_codon:yes gene_type:complete